MLLNGIKVVSFAISCRALPARSIWQTWVPT